MSPEPEQTSGQVEPEPTEGGTPAPKGAETTGQEEAKPEFLTRAEAEQLKQDILNESRSYADKGRVRVEKAVAEVTNSVARMRELGQEITPEQEQALKEAATKKAMTSTDAEPAGEPQGQMDPNIVEIQQEKDIELYDGDPELAMLDRTHGLRKFYQSIEVACDAKKSRLASSKKEPSNPASRLPAEGAPAQGIPEDMPASEAWKRVKHKT